MSLLDNIRVFVRVAELGSFSAASRDLRISPAVTSHRIKALERYLGVRLFNRTTRQLQATEQGEIYYKGCLEVLHALEEAEAAVAAVGGWPRGALRVTAPLGLGRHVISPAVPGFNAEFPEIEVRLRLSDHVLDLMHEGVDAAFRLGVLGDSSFTMRKVVDCERVICASPDYIARRGLLASPEELAEHDCLLLRFPGSTQFQWQLQGPDGPLKLGVKGRFDADDGDVLTSWALAGHGLVLKPLFEVAGHLRAGALRVVLPHTPPEPVTLAILYPHRRLLAPKVKVFADYMIEECRRAISAALDGLSSTELRETG